MIYSFGHLLPDVDLPDDDSDNNNKDDRPPSPIRRIARLLGKHDQYSEVFDPVVDTQSLSTILSDDLADIYLDLKRPLIKFDTNTDANQRIATWEWRFNLQGHCGDHLTDALRPIHRLVFDHMNPDYKND